MICDLKRLVSTPDADAVTANQDMSLSVKTRDGKLWGTDDKGPAGHQWIVNRRLFVS